MPPVVRLVKRQPSPRHPDGLWCAKCANSHVARYEWVEITLSRSDYHQLGRNTSQAWALVRNEEGSEKQAWLETVESYPFTAKAAVRSVEKLFSMHQIGVLTPALAFGADFVLEIPGTKSVDGVEVV